jgi:hypothetical protein
MVSSGLALLAAMMIFRLGDGPHLKRRHGTPPLRLGRVVYAFSVREFRASALGYFGHQWELYAFWTLTPALIIVSGLALPGSGALSGLAFAIIGIGALGCVIGGWWSQRIGSARVAATAPGHLGRLLCPLSLAGRYAGLVQAALAAPLGGQCGGRFPAFLGHVGQGVRAGNCRQRPGFSELDRLRHHHAVDPPGHRLDRPVGAAIAWLLLPGPIVGLIGLYPLWRKGH